MDVSDGMVAASDDGTRRRTKIHIGYGRYRLGLECGASAAVKHEAVVALRTEVCMCEARVSLGEVPDLICTGVARNLGLRTHRTGRNLQLRVRAKLASVDAVRVSGCEFGKLVKAQISLE